MAHFNTITDYTRAIREDNIRKGFRPASGGPGDNTFGDYIALAHSELSEALEAYRDYKLADATEPMRCAEPNCAHAGSEFLRDRCPQDHAGATPKPEGVGSELADTMIRLMDMADVFGVDLDFEIQRKIAYNRTRSYRHGGRTLSDQSDSA